MGRVTEIIAPDIFDLCSPFFNKTGLNGFSYSRLFVNGGRCEVWSDAAAFNHTFHEARYIVGAYTPQYFDSSERYSILDKKIDSYPDSLRVRYKNQLSDQREYFDHDHCIAIINKRDEFCEYFIYYAPRNNGMAINFYLNNFDVLEKFSSYF